MKKNYTLILIINRENIYPNLMTLLGTNITMNHVLNTFDISSLSEFEDVVAEDPDWFRKQQMMYQELCSTLVSPIGDGWSSCPTKQLWEELLSTITLVEGDILRDGEACVLTGLCTGPNGKEYELPLGHYIPETYHNVSHPINEEPLEATMIIPFVDNNTIYYQKVIIHVNLNGEYDKVRFDYEILPLLLDYPVFTYIPAVISKK